MPRYVFLASDRLRPAGILRYDDSGGLASTDSDKLTLQDFIFSTYNSLLDTVWRMQEINQMDMLGLLKV